MMGRCATGVLKRFIVLFSTIGRQTIAKAESLSKFTVFLYSRSRESHVYGKWPFASYLARQCSTQPAETFFGPPKPFEEDELSQRERATRPSKAGILAGVEADNTKKQLVMIWEEGRRQIFPFVWLRDNCRCAQCFHPVALARLTYVYQLDVDITTQKVGISPGGKSVIIQWEDGHVSQFPADWLSEYSFNDSPDDRLLDPKHKLWGADVDLQKFEFDDLLENDQSLYDWLAALVTQGIAVVKNAPLKVGQLPRLGERVAFLRFSNYGPTFQVKSKVDPSNAAFTSGTLGLHTDLAYYIWEPGIQMLHCIDQAECTGGESMFSDGFKVAMDLKHEDPEAFRLLTTLQFEFFDVGKDFYGEFHQHARHPTITLDERGEIKSVSLSDHSRHPMLRAPLDMVLPLYRALKKYNKMLVDPKNVLRYKMEPGDIMTFNNRRALHGRSAFQVTKISSRHLEGGYLEWDEVNSRLRVLAAKLRKHAAS